MRTIVTLYFDTIWNELGANEQYRVVKDNLNLITDDELVAELEDRGYEVSIDQ